MGQAYTPGLRVASRTLVRKRRLLPLKGNVVVELGSRVGAEQVVAQTHLPGDVHSVNVVNRLGIQASEIRTYMLKTEGDPVVKGETMALSKSLFGLLKNPIPSPIDGSIESISAVTGQVLLRTPPKPVELKAFVDGTVVEIVPDEGVVVESEASFIQGIFGVGRETCGEIAVVSKSAESRLDPGELTAAHKGKLVVGGSFAPYETIIAARDLGVAGLIVGGIHDRDLKRLLGYDLGVAITGGEAIGITVVVTEGFGEIAMAQRTFDLLKEREGQQASLSGATQIRAGVMRPEVIVPFGEPDPNFREQEQRVCAMGEGTSVRCIRRPYFGRIGRISALPVELQKVESETKVRVAQIELDGVVVTVPRANLEVIER